MDTDIKPVEICDLRHGHIVFRSDISSSSEGRRFRLVVMDRDQAVHELDSRAVDGALKFDLPLEVRPILGFSMVNTETGSTVFEAANLFPETDRDFETQFKSARDRHGDPRVDHFVASQIVNHFTGAAGYRVSAAVVAAYKAIELMDDEYLRDAESMLLRSISTLPNVSLARSARNNREHLHVSVLCALYHVHLARGDSVEFLRTLNVLRALLEGETFQSYYNLAYNSALSLRLLTMLYLLAEKPSEARTTASLSFSIFKLASRDADENMAHFKELRYVHDNTYESMRIARRVRQVPDALLEKTLRGCLRVSADQHPEAFQRMCDTYKESATRLSQL